MLSQGDVFVCSPCHGGRLELLTFHFHHSQSWGCNSLIPRKLIRRSRATPLRIAKFTCRRTYRAIYLVCRPKSVRPTRARPRQTTGAYGSQKTTYQTCLLTRTPRRSHKGTPPYNSSSVLCGLLILGDPIYLCLVVHPISS